MLLCSTVSEILRSIIMYDSPSEHDQNNKIIPKINIACDFLFHAATEVCRVLQ